MIVAIVSPSAAAQDAYIHKVMATSSRCYRFSVQGRKACDRSEVNERTRAFATYGLGLVAYANNNIELKGFGWNTSVIRPTTAQLGTGTNWIKKATSVKDCGAVMGNFQ